MWLIVVKEMRDFIYSPKFLLLFIAACILVFVSIANGYLNYEKELAYAESSQKESLEHLQKNANFNWVTYTVTRKPSRLSIFDPGVSGFIGRKTHVRSTAKNSMVFGNIGARTYSSKYGDDPVLSMFGELSLSFVVSVVFSLFAVIMGYSSVSGEKENGTLKLILSTGASRTSFFFGKLIGGFIPLVLLLLIPLLIAFTCLLLLTDINFTGNDYFAMGLQVLGYLSFIFLFYMISLTCSCFSKKSFTAFMASLIIWVAVIAILPKAISQMTERAVGTPNISEMSKKQDKFWDQMWRERNDKMIKFINSSNIKESEYRDKMREFSQQYQTEMSTKVNENSRKLSQEYLRRQLSFEGALENSARVTPFASLQFIAQGTANTDHKLGRYMNDKAKVFEKVLDEFADKKRKEKEKEQKNYKYKREYNIKPDSNGYMKLKFTNVKNERVKLNMSGLPKFDLPDPKIEELIAKFVFDFALLMTFSIIFMIGGFFRFLSYDVR